jgi:hypothetical protein
MTLIVSTGYVNAISPGNFFFNHGDGSIPLMQTVQDTRRQRVGILKKKYGKWSELNDALGWERTNTRLSQIHSGTLRSDRGTPYTMGDDTAREIETKLGLPVGWMDTPPSLAEQFGHSEPLDKMAELMAVMEPAMQYQAVRVVGALVKPAEGTNGEKH